MFGGEKKALGQHQQKCTKIGRWYYSLLFVVLIQVQWKHWDIKYKIKISWSSFMRTMLKYKQVIFVKSAFQYFNIFNPWGSKHFIPFIFSFCYMGFHATASFSWLSFLLLLQFICVLQGQRSAHKLAQYSRCVLFFDMVGMTFLDLSVPFLWEQTNSREYLHEEKQRNRNTIVALYHRLSQT